MVLFPLEEGNIELYIYTYICMYIYIYIYHILHLQAIRQQLQKKGCVQDYFKSEPMQKVYRMYCSIAFVPPAEIVQWWDEVIGGYISMIKVNYRLEKIIETDHRRMFGRMHSLIGSNISIKHSLVPRLEKRGRYYKNCKNYKKF